MILGHGPRIAPAAQDISVYRNAPISKMLGIGSYIGAPIYNDDGTLFGTLCAIDPRKQDSSIARELPLIELCADMLSRSLGDGQRFSRQEKRLQEIQVLAERDPLTQVFNRYGWDTQLAKEENRALRYDHDICVMIIDLDCLKENNDNYGHAYGDEMLRRTGQCIKNLLRENDIVARIGGDEFAIMAVECDLEQSEVLYNRIKHALANAKIAASIGKAMFDPKQGLAHAVIAADIAMYRAKSANRNGRIGPSRALCIDS